MNIKNILLIIITLMFCNTVLAQTPPTSVQPTENNIVPGHYFIDDNINKFTGTWRWTSGTDTVIISLKKLKHTFDDIPPVFYHDWLYGCHKYIKNGQLLESTMQNFSSTNVNVFNIVGYSNRTDSTKADLLFTKNGRQARYYLTLKFAVGTSPQKLIWHTDRKYSNNWDQIIPLPRDMVLTKQ